MSAQRTAVHSHVGSVDISRCSSSRAAQRAEQRPMRGHGMNLSMVEFNTPLDVAAPASRASGKFVERYTIQTVFKDPLQACSLGESRAIRLLTMIGTSIGLTPSYQNPRRRISSRSMHGRGKTCLLPPPTHSSMSGVETSTRIALVTLASGSRPLRSPCLMKFSS